jgi:hypothetical protein
MLRTLMLGLATGLALTALPSHAEDPRVEAVASNVTVKVKGEGQAHYVDLTVDVTLKKDETGWLAAKRPELEARMVCIAAGDRIEFKTRSFTYDPALKQLQPGQTLSLNSPASLLDGMSAAPSQCEISLSLKATFAGAVGIGTYCYLPQGVKEGTCPSAPAPRVATTSMAVPQPNQSVLLVPSKTLITVKEDSPGDKYLELGVDVTVKKDTTFGVARSSKVFRAEIACIVAGGQVRDFESLKPETGRLQDISTGEKARLKGRAFALKRLKDAPSNCQLAYYLESPFGGGRIDMGMACYRPDKVTEGVCPNEPEPAPTASAPPEPSAPTASIPAAQPAPAAATPAPASTPAEEPQASAPAQPSTPAPQPAPPAVVTASGSEAKPAEAAPAAGTAAAPTTTPANATVSADSTATLPAPAAPARPAMTVGGLRVSVVGATASKTKPRTSLKLAFDLTPSIHPPKKGFVVSETKCTVAAQTETTTDKVPLPAKLLVNKAKRVELHPFKTRPIQGPPTSCELKLSLDAAPEPSSPLATWCFQAGRAVEGPCRP